MPKSRVRESARVVCIDERDRVLLFKTHFHGRVAPARWLTPGGGIEPGEDAHEAAVRELFEETGLRDAKLVGPIAHTRVPLPAGHVFDAADMTTFLLRTATFDISRAGWMPDEHDDILDIRWWSADELRTTHEELDAEDVLATLDRLAGGMPEPGDRVTVHGRKWDGSRHWRYDTEALGTDKHGTWLGVRAGSEIEKRKRTIATDHAFVRLVPTPKPSWHEGSWMLPGYWIGHDVGCYVDVTTPPTVRRDGDGWLAEYIDLDLDLIVPSDGSKAWIDDEAEFAERSKAMRWPGWVIDRTRDVADELLADAKQGRTPAAKAAKRWCALLAGEK